jgi:hypothetical protein
VPYKIGIDKSSLIPYKDLSSIAPRTVEYLRECKSRLDQREKGRFKGEYWYCYGRPQNLNRFEVPEKIVMPDVVNRGECFLDTRGLWLLDTAYALVPLSNKPVNIRYILGILNSPILTYFFERNRFCIKGWIFSNENSLLKSVSFPNN